jgi:hypothetical protein
MTVSLQPTPEVGTPDSRGSGPCESASLDPRASTVRGERATAPRLSMRSSGLEPPRTIRSTSPQPYSSAPYASARVQIVRFVRDRGRMGSIGRSECCHDVATTGGLESDETQDITVHQALGSNGGPSRGRKGEAGMPFGCGSRLVRPFSHPLEGMRPGLRPAPHRASSPSASPRPAHSTKPVAPMSSEARKLRGSTLLIIPLLLVLSECERGRCSDACSPKKRSRITDDTPERGPCVEAPSRTGS